VGFGGKCLEKEERYGNFTTTSRELKLEFGICPLNEEIVSKKF
jgi:hypothetical protein